MSDLIPTPPESQKRRVRAAPSVRQATQRTLMIVGRRIASRRKKLERFKKATAGVRK